VVVLLVVRDIYFNKKDYINTVLKLQKMANAVEISSINFSGQQANIIFTPNGSEISYGLGIQTLPYMFNTLSINDTIDIYGKYSIDLISSNCSYILVI
jgi:hypothetical protein